MGECWGNSSVEFYECLEKIQGMAGGVQFNTGVNLASVRNAMRCNGWKVLVWTLIMVLAITWRFLFATRHCQC